MHQILVGWHGPHTLLALQSESTVAHFMTMIPDSDASQVLAIMKAQSNPSINILSIDNAQIVDRAMMAQHQQDDPHDDHQATWIVSISICVSRRWAVMHQHKWLNVLIMLSVKIY